MKEEVDYTEEIEEEIEEDYDISENNVIEVEETDNKL